MSETNSNPDYNEQLLPISQVNAFLVRSIVAQEVNTLEYPGVSVLAALLSCPNFDPDTELAFGSDKYPVLHRVLRAMAARVVQDSDYTDKYVRVSLDGSAPLPQGIHGLPAFERAAIHLLRLGADPWVSGPDGKDAFDLSVAARSRTLVDMLMSHPARPTLDQLTARTNNAVGREVPFTHVASYLSSPELFADLVTFGWDYAATDRNGWTAMAWANSPAVLKKLAKYFTPDQLGEMSMDVSNAFSQRHSKKLTSSSFALNIMKAQLDGLVVPSEDQLIEQELFALSETLLANNPTKKSYHYKGPDFRYHNDEVIAFTEKCREHFSWRREVKAGAAKGTWSLPAMLIWAISRGQSDKRAYENTSDFIQKLLSEKTPEQRKAWLDEEIRPGVSNRGLLAWGMSQVMSQDLANALSEGLNSPVQQLLAQATDFVEKFSGKNVAYQWAERLTENWKHLALNFAWPQACDRVSGSCQPWFYEAFSRATSVNRVSLPEPTYGFMASDVSKSLSCPAPTSSDMALACCLLSYSHSSLTSRNQPIYRESDVPSQYYDRRRTLLESFVQALEAHPYLVSEHDFTYPFKNKSKTHEESFPDEAEWKSLIKRAGLANIAAKASTQSSSVRRPSM